MNRRAWLLPVCLCLALAGSHGRVIAQEPPPAAEIRNLSLDCRDARLRVSFRLEGALTEQNVDRLLGGLEVRVSHRIRLQRRRALFAGTTLAEVLLEATASYDSLTKTYTLTRFRDGQQVETRTSAGEAEMRDFLGVATDIDLAPASVLEGESKVVVRVRSAYDPTFILWIMPSIYTATRDKDVDREDLKCK